jgi:ectoine hydroxylase-related dioxygenase (phytanoyl-CoA dioxygenase family)
VVQFCVIVDDTDLFSLFHRDEVRENVGLFFTKGYYRQSENQYLMVPPEQARGLSTQVKRLLGYGISRPGVGFYHYQDPMRVLYGVEDEDTVDL